MPKVRADVVLVLEGDDDAVEAAVQFITDMCQMVNVTVTPSWEGPKGNGESSSSCGRD
jgi:hypothetical protein